MAEPVIKPESLLDPDAIARAETLGLHARLIVEGYLVGEHRSPYHGFSVEFAQHRPYVSGDDLRHFDWKMLGRTDRSYVKQYEQETNFVAHLLLDGSASMQYGSGRWTKLHYGKMLAACLAYLVLHQRDAVTLAVFNETDQVRVPRTNGIGGLVNLLTALAAFEARGTACLSTVLHELARQARRRGLVVLISDCLEEEQPLLEGIEHLRFGGHEVIVFHVLDPCELEFPLAGNIEFVGLENEPRLRVRPREICRSYQEAVDEFCARLRLGCEQNNAHYVLADTRKQLAEMLTAYLAFRRRIAP